MTEPPAPPGLPEGAALHPWNRGFTWRTPAAAPRLVSAAQRADFERDGFLALPAAIAPGDVAAALVEIDAIEAKVEGFLRTRPDERLMIAEAGAITFATHLVTRSARLRALAAHRVFADLCHDLVGPDANLYWDQAVYKKPEKPRRFPWHQDNGYTYVEPQHYLTCWLALTDATEENGCPVVAPGLHRLGTLRHRYVEPLGYECFETPARAIAVPAAAGSIVVFSSLTPHCTGPNRSGATRKAYILQYAPPGAEACGGDPDAGPPATRTPCDDPVRQFPVLRGGSPVAWLDAVGAEEA